MIKYHPIELKLPNLTAMQKQAITVSGNLTDMVARLGIWEPDEIQMVIDQVQNNCDQPDDELEAEALQHLFTFLICMRERAKAP